MSDEIIVGDDGTVRGFLLISSIVNRENKDFIEDLDERKKNNNFCFLNAYALHEY